MGPEIYREAYQLKKSGVKILKGNYVYIITSKSIPNNQLFLQYKELESLKFNSWKRYKELRSEFYIVKPSTRWIGCLECTCFDGIKKRPCKHAVMMMCANKMLKYPPDACAKPLEGKKKSGRPKKAKNTLLKD